MLVNTFPIVNDKKSDCVYLRSEQLYISSEYELNKILSGEYTITMKVINRDNIKVIGIKKEKLHFRNELLCYISITDKNKDNGNINKKSNKVNNQTIKKIKMFVYDYYKNNKININKEEIDDIVNSIVNSINGTIKFKSNKDIKNYVNRFCDEKLKK